MMCAPCHAKGMAAACNNSGGMQCVKEVGRGTCSASVVVELQRFRLLRASSLECRMALYCRLTLDPKEACSNTTAAWASPSLLQHLLKSRAASL